MISQETLNTIQSGSIDEVYLKVTDTALYMAAGGFLNEANQLLSSLWKHKLPHEKSVWLQDTAFTILWAAAGSRPDFIPFDLQDIDLIERKMRAYIAVDRWAYPMPDNPWQELTGKDLLRKAFITASLNQSLPAPSTDQFPTAAAELEALSMLEKLSEGDQISDEGLALGAELAARHGERKRAINLIKHSGERKSGHLSFRLYLLAAGRHVAPLLLEGVIARELKLSNPIVTTFLQFITDVLDKRIKQGQSLAYGNLDWKQLLKEISKTSIACNPGLYEKDAIDAEWLGRTSAPASEIAEAELRLGVTLPKDYKTFLQVSNGFNSLRTTRPSLSPVNRIDYVKHIIDGTQYEVLCDFSVSEDDPETFESYLSRATLISEYPDEQMIWLIAPKKDEGWQTWFFAYWAHGEHRHAGFRYFMEKELLLNIQSYQK